MAPLVALVALGVEGGSAVLAPLANAQMRYWESPWPFLVHLAFVLAIVVAAVSPFLVGPQKRRLAWGEGLALVCVLALWWGVFWAYARPSSVLGRLIGPNTWTVGGTWVIAVAGTWRLSAHMRETGGVQVHGRLALIGATVIGLGWLGLLVPHIRLVTALTSLAVVIGWIVVLDGLVLLARMAWGLARAPLALAVLLGIEPYGLFLVTLHVLGRALS